MVVADDHGALLQLALVQPAIGFLVDEHFTQTALGTNAQLSHRKPFGNCCAMHQPDRVPVIGETSFLTLQNRSGSMPKTGTSCDPAFSGSTEGDSSAMDCFFAKLSTGVGVITVITVRRRVGDGERRDMLGGTSIFPRGHIRDGPSPCARVHLAARRARARTRWLRTFTGDAVIANMHNGRWRSWWWSPAPAGHGGTQSHELRSWAYSSRSRVMPSSPTRAAGRGTVRRLRVWWSAACCMAALAVRRRSGRGVVHFDLQPTVVHSSGSDWMAWGHGAGDGDGAGGAAFMGRFWGVAGGWFGANPTEHRVRSFFGAETL